MSSKYVVGFDDSVTSRRALEFARSLAAENGASIVVAHVLEWSPYTFLTPEELEERHKRRNEELARAEKGLAGSLESIAGDSAINFETVIRYGHVADTIAAIAVDCDATQIFIGRNGQSGLTARVFGSVAGSLAQTSPVPCTIVP